MIGLSAFTVFALGLRHGADPDHLAAIDNMTRNTAAQRPGLSRFVGTFFAAGHSVMVLAIAALVGSLGTKFAAQHTMIENIGTVISIVVLLIIAGMNIRQITLRPSGGLTGLKARLIPAGLRNSSNPLVAMVVGLLFGFGFETSSQVATYALAFGSSGWIGAVGIGALFSLGMIVTDTLDSILVHRLLANSGATVHQATRTVRIWIATVTLMALVVAAYEAAQLFGWQSPVPDIDVSAALVAALFIVFVYVFMASRKITSKSNVRAF